MANLILPRRRRGPPSGAVRIDWSHPLAEGLVFYALPARIGMPELVGGGAVTPLTNGVWQTGSHGPAFGSSSTTGGGWRVVYDASGASHSLRGIVNDFTVACNADLDAIIGFSTLVSAPHFASSWTAPYTIFALGRYQSTDQVAVKMGTAAGTRLARFASGTFATGKDQHWIASRSGTSASLLFNQTIYSPTASDLPSDNVTHGSATHVALLNRSSGSNGEGTQGAVYYAAVWKRALSDAEKWQVRENPYCFLKPVSTSIPVSLFGDIAEARVAAGAVTTPMQQATGAASYPNMFPAPSTWTTIAGPGTVDVSDSPPTITIHSAGGTPTSIRKQVVATVTIGAHYRLGFNIATNTAQVIIGTSNGGSQYKNGALSSSQVGAFSFEFTATSASLWLQFQRTTAGDSVLSDFTLQQLDRAPNTIIDNTFASPFAIPVQQATGASENIGLFTASGAATTPIQQAAGASIFVNENRVAAGTITAPMQQASGSAQFGIDRSASGTASLPGQQAAGAAWTRYNSARRINGSTQYFQYTDTTTGQTNRNWSLYGWVRMESLPAGGVYIADFGNTSSTATSSSGRVRLVYDTPNNQFFVSTASTDGTQYRESRSGTVSGATSRWIFVGISVLSTGDVRVTVDKTTTTTATGAIPASSLAVCDTLRLGTAAKTTLPTGFQGLYSNWIYCRDFTPTTDQLTMLADGYYPAQVPGLTPTAIWPMLESGAAETNLQPASFGSPYNLSAVSSPPVAEESAFPPFDFGEGWATIPMQQAAGTSFFLALGDGLSGNFSIPIQTISGATVAEPAGLRGNITTPMQLASGTATRTIPDFQGGSGGGTSLKFDSTTVRFDSGIAEFSGTNGAIPPQNLTITIPMQRASGTATFVPASSVGATFYASRLYNTASTATLANQEFHCGLPIKRGDVPAGYIVKAFINNAECRTQLSRRRFWDDGSLKFAETSIELPSIPIGGIATIEWRKFAGSWTAQDTALHTSPTAVVNRMSAEWRAVSWANRPTTVTLGTDIGPIRFTVADMLSASNAQWTKTIYAGHLVTEWESSIMGLMPSGARHPDFGAILYVRAWGGTTNNPRRIQFGFKSMYGWDDNSIPADHTGYQCSWDLYVGGTVRRGVSLSSPGQEAVNGAKGTAHFSFGQTGEMDWYDVATGGFNTLPTIVHKHTIPYFISGRFLPPIDLSNSADTTAAKMNTFYTPNTRGLTYTDMSDVGDRDDISWTVTGWTARSMITHEDRYPIATTAGHQQTCRTQALAVAAIPAQGYMKSDRTMVSHLPVSRVPDSRFLPTYLITSSGIVPEAAYMNWSAFSVVEDSHFPQLSYYNYLLEGNHHVLKLLYTEAAAPGIYTAPLYGANTSIMLRDEPGQPQLAVGGMNIRGQMRGVAHSCRQIGQAVGIGHPDDKEWTYYERMLTDWCRATRNIPAEEDQWRGGTSHQDAKIYRSLNEPVYKVWMHALILHMTSFVAGLTRRPDVTERAHWFSELLKVAMGGYNDDPDLDKHTLITPYTVDEIYYTIFATGVPRIPFVSVQQWGQPANWTYNSNNTISAGTSGNHEGAAFTPFGAGGPAVLNRGQKYYAVNVTGTQINADGNPFGGTFQLSATRGGPAINFGISAPVTAQALYRVYPPTSKVPVTTANALNQGQNVGFGLQMIAAMKNYYHSVGPDLVAEKAIKATEAYKISGGWAEKAKWTVTYTNVVEPEVDIYEVWNGVDKVYVGADEVWSEIPPDTYNGDIAIPMPLAAGTFEWVPGLPGDARGSVTIPAQTVAGTIEAPELVFSVAANLPIPMQQIVATMTRAAPGQDIVGNAAVPMLTATGSIQNATHFSFGNALVPMVQLAGEMTRGLPQFDIVGGDLAIPMQTVAGSLFTAGVPMQGDIIIPMVQATGEATSQQFSYEANGAFYLPVPAWAGEAYLFAHDVNGGVTVPMQSAEGIFAFQTTSFLMEGAGTIPMLTASGTATATEQERIVTGTMPAPLIQWTGEADLTEFIGIAGNFTIPAFQPIKSAVTGWQVVPKTREEAWTLITPT